MSKMGGRSQKSGVPKRDRGHSPKLGATEKDRANQKDFCQSPSVFEN